MKRTAGVLMHVSSLWGEYSTGTFGKSALEWIDFLADLGFSFWQVLPFGIPDFVHSPYKSLSAFAGNPYFLDPEVLAEPGYLTAEELEEAKQETPYSCEFERLDRERMPLLRRAAARAMADAEVRAAVETWLAENPQIGKFCEFMALRRANGETMWRTWTEKKGIPEERDAWAFFEYEFFREWEQIRGYAKERGIRIIGDIPFYLDEDSCDVWANPEEFQLDESGAPSSVAGVPPDYFSEDGQLWGNPLYDWDAMAKNGYRFWRERLGTMFRLFDGVRIDHFRAVSSYWSIPAGAETAKEGTWVPGPGMALVDALKETAAAAGEGKFLIAEDLGDIDDDVKKLVEDSGFPGMRVLQFGFLGGADSPHLPHEYPAECVAYTGTHDNNTLLGYVWGLDPETRRRMLAYCGYTYQYDDWDRPAAYDAVIRTLLASHADTVIVPIQDLLRYGSDTRMNVPGVQDGNWLWRVTKEQIDGISREDRERLRAWIEMYHR